MITQDALRQAYAPTGVLRVALNHGNGVLVGRTAQGQPVGISVDLAQRLGRSLGLRVAFVEYLRAVDVSDRAEADVWDVCFLAVDPKRAAVIDFTQPYVQIEGAYLAAAHCPARSAAELVASGARVASVIGSAYTLTLERQPGAEALVQMATLPLALRAMDAGQVAAVAGIGAVMQAEASKRPGARVLAPPFMQIRQAMGIVRGRGPAAAHLRAFVTSLAASGEVGEILERHGVQRACAVPPEAPDEPGTAAGAAARTAGGAAGV